MGQTDLQGIRNSRDALAAGLPVFKVLSDGAIKAYKDDQGVRRFSLTASSDADDLVGDFFAEKALKRMESAAPGTTMFLNHDYIVPESVFGAVEKADLVRREVELQGGEKCKILCLDYDGVVEETNERAVKTHEMMMGDRVKLGGSVSVLITEKSNMKDGRRRIEDVYYLECSVVGIPCNPTAWVQSASKALNGQASKSDHSDGAVDLEAGLASALVEEPATEKTNAAPQGETMKARFKDARTAIQNRLSASVVKSCENCKGTGKTVSKTIESDCLVCKGRFNELLQQCESSIYHLTDILTYALWDLYYECVYYETDVDASAELAAICDEFKESVLARLLPILTAKDEGDDGAKSLARVESAKTLASFLGFNEPMSKAIEAVAKVGRRNSGSDQKMIDEVHNLIVDLGAACKGAEVADVSAAAPDADKTASQASGQDTESKALTDQITELKSKLTDAEAAANGSLKIAESALDERDRWKASSLVALAALEKYGRQPMQRRP
jgi:hypothetical protein